MSEPKDTINNVPTADATGKDACAINELIGPLDEVSCQSRKSHHKIKTLQHNKESVMEKLKLLLTTQELN